MPVPVIVAGAAAIAARLAAKKAAQELAKKAAKATATKSAQIAKNSVKTKTAARQVGNPPNNTKAWEDYIGSVSRGGAGRGSAGKAKATRVANSKIAKKTVPSAKEPARIPEIPARATVKINSAVSKTADQARANARGLKAANKPTKASKVQRKVTSTKKMENVPKDVSDRFSATIKRLAAEEAKKKK